MSKSDRVEKWKVLQNIHVFRVLTTSRLVRILNIFWSMFSWPLTGLSADHWINLKSSEAHSTSTRTLERQNSPKFPGDWQLLSIRNDSHYLNNLLIWISNSTAEWRWNNNNSNLLCVWEFVDAILIELRCRDAHNNWVEVGRERE